MLYWQRSIPTSIEILNCNTAMTLMRLMLATEQAAIGENISIQLLFYDSSIKQLNIL